MKKKVKDLTLGEIDKLCNQSAVCDDCPLRCLKIGCQFIMADDLEKEVEIDE